MWEDKSITVGYEDKGVERTKEINMGTVTEGDTLVKLAEMQLKEERGDGKFSGKEVRNKIEQIKQLNNLESDTIKVGQNLILGFSNERVIGEKGVEGSDIDLLIAGGMAYGLTKAGIAGAAMLMNAALSTEAGVTASLYAGAISAAVQSGIQNGTLMVNAIQSIPGIGNMMLMYGPQINQYGGAFINGFMPSGTSTFRDDYEALCWLIGWGVGELNK
ncbi:MAG: LysM peptidoglycan-binding domain-containing protein [Spirochaetota bacterium]